MVTTTTTTEEKAIAFRVAEGIRWIEIGINSINRIIQGAVAIIFGVAIAKTHLLVGGLEQSEYLPALRPLLLEWAWGCLCRVCASAYCGRHGNNNFFHLGGNPWYFYVEKDNGKGDH